jgi:GNAT superfamily N-acetyltransferase
VREALTQEGRQALIGSGCDCLSPTRPRDAAIEARRQRANEADHRHTLPNPPKRESAGKQNRGVLGRDRRARVFRAAERKMTMTAHRVELREIQGMRDMYRHEMNCQIIHDSVHARVGWTQEYLLTDGGTKIGYGSVAVAGPWQAIPSLYEFFVLPQHRDRMFKLFVALLTASGASVIETQSNDPLLTVMLHAFAPTASSESILFHDKLTTTHTLPDAHFRRVTPDDAPQIAEHELDSGASWVVALEGAVAAAGDILFHYNRPYGDIYMKVAESYRRRGVGSYLVQELKRVCYEGGSVPAARCNPKNIASRQTLQKTGFVPCGHILKGTVSL